MQKVSFYGVKGHLSRCHKPPLTDAPTACRHGSGDMAALAELLGGRYFVRGRVSTEGRHVGRRIGYPTANLHLPPEKYPFLMQYS